MRPVGAQRRGWGTWGPGRTGEGQALRFEGRVLRAAILGNYLAESRRRGFRDVHAGVAVRDVDG
jgi:hypothetical protein